MTVKAELSLDGKILTISVKGRFDYAKHQEFRESYGDKELSPVIVDLKEATYLDSSALGMLLLLRDHAGGDDSDIRVVNCSLDVRNILAISNFDKLFDIS